MAVGLRVFLGRRRHRGDLVSEPTPLSTDYWKALETLAARRPQRFDVEATSWETPPPPVGGESDQTPSGPHPSPRGNGRRPERGLPKPLVDQILSFATRHPTAGPRRIASTLALPQFGAWKVSHSAVYNVLRKGGLARRSDRLIAAEALSSTS